MTIEEIIEARERGWATLKNGELLSAAEQAGFDIVVTADKNIRYQQNLTGRAYAASLETGISAVGVAGFVEVEQFPGNCRPSGAANHGRSRAF